MTDIDPRKMHLATFVGQQHTDLLAFCRVNDCTPLEQLEMAVTAMLMAVGAGLVDPIELVASLLSVYNLEIADGAVAEMARH